MSVRKIEIWHQAGLIDAGTRAALLAFEEENTRPLALWAVFGIGALAIGLGLISVVAANWEDVPGQVRLAIHLALLTGSLGAVFLREKRLVDASPWALEALMAIAAVLGLTFFGHLGQVYQTGSPLWKPLAAWLVLFGPALLLTGRSWLSACLVMGGVVYASWEYASANESLFYGVEDAALPVAWLAFVIGAAALFAPVAAFMRARSVREDFWRRLEQLALTYAVAGASFTAGLASVDAFQGEEASVLGPVSLATLAGIGVVAGGCTALARPTLSGRMSGAIIAGSGVTMLLARSVSGVELAAALLFMLLWIGIAAAALKVGWRGVFQLSVAVIAVRLIALSFELASDLLLSGFGLILSGFLILGIAWVAYRVSREFAPPTDEQTAEGNA